MKEQKLASATAVRVAIIAAAASLLVSLVNLAVAFRVNAETRRTAIEVAQQQQKWKEQDQVRAQEQQWRDKFQERIALRIDKRTAELESGLRAIQRMKDAIRTATENNAITLQEVNDSLNQAKSQLVSTYGDAIGPFNQAYHQAKNASINLCSHIQADLRRASPTSPLSSALRESLKTAHGLLTESWNDIMKQCEEQQKEVLKRLKTGNIEE